MSTGIDEAFLPLAAFFEEMAGLEGTVQDAAAGVAMTVEAAEVSLPIELDLTVEAGGTVALGAVPPLYYVETTIMPVFHQITLTLEPLRHPTDDL